METKALRRSQAHNWLGGVCAGIAYGFGFPVWVMRVLFLVLFFAGVGFPIFLYILLWILMPKWEQEPSDYAERVGE